MGTWKDFHERLGGDDFVSYAAVRNYHTIGSDQTTRTKRQFGEEVPADERIAPAPYLAKVAKEFDIRLEWLITGEGPVTAEEYQQWLLAEGTHQDMRELWEEVPFLEGTLNASIFLGAWMRLASPWTGLPGGITPLQLAAMLLQPLASFDVAYRPKGDEWADYLHAMLHALMLIPVVHMEAQREADPEAFRSAADDLVSLTTQEADDE